MLLSWYFNIFPRLYVYFPTFYPSRFVQLIFLQSLEIFLFYRRLAFAQLFEEFVSSLLLDQNDFRQNFPLSLFKFYLRTLITFPFCVLRVLITRKQVFNDICSRTLYEHEKKRFRDRWSRVLFEFSKLFLVRLVLMVWENLKKKIFKLRIYFPYKFREIIIFIYI